MDTFLQEIRKLILDDKFLFIKKRIKEKDQIEYTNSYCMQELGFDSDDVKSEVLGLTTKEFFEILFDDKDFYSNKLYVFFKTIQGRQVYIKLKIKDNDDGERALCISFHFPQHEVHSFPFT